MRSRSGAALFTLALVFLLLGLASLRWELVGLVIPLAVALYVNYLVHRPPRLNLGMERWLESERVQEGEEVEVRLRVENRGERLDYLEVLDGVPIGAEVVEGRESFPLGLRAGEAAEVTYRLRFPHRGAYSFGDIRARWSDPLLMAPRWQTRQASNRVLVLPKVQDLRKCGLRPSQLRVVSGNLPSSSLGPGTEFFCLRDYVPGDELRRVNWKATARRERLLVNDFQRERSGDVVILVDGRCGDHGTEVRDLLFDKQVDAATSLASHLLKERNRVGLLVLGETIGMVPLAYGKRQFHRILDRLLASRPGSLRSTQSLKMAMSRYFPTSSLVLAISPLEDRRIVDSLIEMRGKGQDIFVLALDPFPLMAGKAPSAGVAEVAGRMHHLRRKDVLTELARYDRVVDWDPRVPLSKYLMGGGASANHRR